MVRFGSREKYLSFTLLIYLNKIIKLFLFFLKFNRFFQFFIQIGCDFNLKDANGFSSLHLATQLNNYAGVVNLLQIPTIDLNVIYYFNIN